MRSWFPLLAASVLALVSGCGSGSSSSGNGTIRLVNATTSATYDFYNGTSQLASGVAPGGASGYASLPAGAYPFYVYPTGTTAAPVVGTSRVITNTLATSLIVYSTGGVLNSAQLTDNQAAPAAGQALFRIFNTSNEAGAVDVYITDPSVTDLKNVAPNATNVVSTRVSGYGSFGAGTYRIRVTSTGNYQDVRLDLPSVPLVNQEIATMVLTTATGGSLLNAVQVDQQGSTTAYANKAARLRLVANVTGSGSVAATLNGAPLVTDTSGAGTAIASPQIGSKYALVPAGTLTGSILVNGAAVTVPSLSLAAGSDASLFVGGSATSPTITLTTEDNAIPNSNNLTSTTQSKVRLFNGLNGLSATMSLGVDFSPLATNVAYGTASTSALFQIGIGGTNTLQATSTGLSAPAFNQTLPLQAGHVYTLFVLGDAGQASQQGFLRQDR